MLHSLSQEILYDLLIAYDSYIYAACEDGRIGADWQPVGIEEFYDCEYQNVWKNRKDDDCFFKAEDADC